MPVECFGAQTPRSLLTLRTELLEATTQLRDIACMLLQRHRPDFACVVFGAAHRAGHYLWDASQVVDRATPNQLSTIETSLTDVYMACDAALGELLERAPRDAVTVVFAVHSIAILFVW